MIRFILTVVSLISASLIIGSSALALNYSAGSYGTCTYDTCGITLSTSSTLAVNVTPSGSATTCSVQNHSVSASTDSSTGYVITLNNNNTSTTLSGPNASTIPSISGTATSPALLTANTWGYRVDDIGNFGAGPTSSTANSAIPSGTFAATPSSAAAGGIIRTTNTSDTGLVTTPVWFGVCVNSTIPAGSYTDGVVFTALIN